VRAERGAGPGLVLDDDGCAKTGLELIGDQAAEKIGGAARRIGHDHLDGSAGIGCLGQGWLGKGWLGKRWSPVSMASPPPHPASAARRVNDIGPPKRTLIF
jgi:hypothetical protein